MASFNRALEASKNGAFAEEIAPVEVKAGKEVLMVKEDENPKSSNEKKL